jgi:site-specific DNA-methyltransferase (adenine-specific)
MKISELKPLERNPFKSKGDEQIKKIADSISSFEKMMRIRKIVIDENNQILGGNKRFFACKRLGMKEIPDDWIDKQTDLTEDEKREFIVKDNSHWGSEWDYDLLKEWDVDLDDWGMDLPDGWEDEKTEAIEDNYEIPDEIETDIVLGDLFEIGEHRLLCGDSTDSDQVAKLMNSEKADMVFTDPDYSMNDNDLFACYSNEKIIDAKVSFWVCGDKQAIKLVMNDIDRFTHFFVHDFKCATLVSNTQPMQRHNLICKFGNVKMTNLKDGFTTIVSVATERTLETHKQTPMAKRVELPAKFIEHYSDIGQIVFDFFLHSGSTMVAAHQLKRKCYGMEIDSKYCQMIIDRMKKLDPDLVIKKNGTELPN